MSDDERDESDGLELSGHDSGWVWLGRAAVRRDAVVAVWRLSPASTVNVQLEGGHLLEFKDLTLEDVLAALGVPPPKGALP